MLVTRDGALCLFYATIQQLVVASSTLFLIEAIRLATSSGPTTSIPYVAAFVTSLVLVYVPNAASMLYLDLWRLDSFARFVQQFIASNGGRATWAHSRDKALHEAWLTNESAVIYDHSTSLIYQAYSTLLSSVLNVGVIALAIDARILVWYVVVAGVLFVSKRLFQGRIVASAASVQTSRQALSSVMLTAWENIFVGNAHNLRTWQGNFANQLTGAKRAEVSNDLVRSVISSLTVAVSLMILTAGNGIYYLENYEHLPAVAALFITLPRQLQIVQNIFALFDLLLSWQGVRQQLAQLEHTLSLTQVQKDLTQYVQLEQLSFSVDGCTKRYTGVSEVLGALKQTEPRRVTLRGRNASGKSTVLAMLAEATGEESFYLPTNYVDLAFATRGLGDRSDGARMLGVFQEISEITGLRYVLLDEWDANLDKENVALIDATIARLARHKVVVESRHHV